MRKFKKAAAIVLAIAMIATLVSVNVFAASTLNLYYTLEATAVENGQFTLNLYGADDASGEVKNPDGLYVTMTQVELTFDPSVVTVADGGGRKNLYAGTTINIDNTKGLIKMASLNAKGDEITGKDTALAVLNCTVVDPSKSSAVFTPQNLAAQDENAEFLTADQIHAEPITVNLGGAQPDPTPTADPTAPPVDPTAPPVDPTAPPVDPTATPEGPTATPAANVVSVSTGAATLGKDFAVTVKRTDATEEATVVVTLTPEKEGAAPITKTVTFPAGETSIKVVFTEADLAAAQLAAKDKVAVSVSYNGETVKINGQDNKEVTFKAPGSGSSNNDGLSTTPVSGENVGPSTGTAAPDATAAPAAPTAEATVFTDVPADYWGYDYIMDLYNAGIISGATATTFLPENNITRAEFTKIAVGVFGLTATSQTSQFTDVPADEWFAPYVIAATEAGIVQGISATEFGPNENITREQMATIIGRQLGLTSDAAITYTDAAQISDYAKTYVGAMSEAGYLTGDNGQFRPQDNATRAEAATLLDRVYTDLKPAAPEATTAPEATEAPEAEATASPEASAEATATPAE